MANAVAAAVEIHRRLPTPPGQDVLVRPLRREDIGELAAGFRRLSARTRYQRFFAATGPNLSAAQLAYLTEIDHHDHEALVAIAPETEQIVGVARFIRSRTRPDSAEIAVTIADAWQQRGVGTQLLRRLVDRALQEGITQFTAEILTANRGMLALIHKAGHATTETDGTTTTATIILDPTVQSHGEATRRRSDRRQVGDQRPGLRPAG